MALKLLRLYSQKTILSIEKITMRSFVVAIGLGASLLLFSGQADAQYMYTDDKGVSKVTQYKLDIPEPYRDAAVWVGPTGVGKPGLSEEARQTKQREDAYRRIGEADAGLAKYGKAPAPTTGVPYVGQPPESTTCVPTLVERRTVSGAPRAGGGYLPSGNMAPAAIVDICR